MSNGSFRFMALVTQVNGKTGSVVLNKTDIGLGNVDNTSDADKPVSIATQNALNLKANINSILATPLAVFDGSGIAVSTGQVFYFVAPYTGTITKWSILAKGGTCTIKVWKKASGTTLPTASDSINTSGLSLVTGEAIESTDVSDFTTVNITKGDILAFNPFAVSGATLIVFELEITRNTP